MLAVGDTADAPEGGPTPDARHFHERVDLGDDIMIGPLDSELTDQVLDGLERRGLNAPEPYRLVGSLYALIRENAPEVESPRNVDPDQRLRRAAAILRLVRPHAISAGDMARVQVDGHGQPSVIPNSVVGPGSAAFVVDAANRWIRDEDVTAAKSLLEGFVRLNETLPERVGRALYAHEMAHWQRDGDVRWPLIAMAMEGLVHTDDRGREHGMGNQAQFVERWTKLRSFLPELTLSEEELRNVYDHRSHTMHGGSFSRLWEQPHFTSRYAAAEAALRVVIGAAILRPGIRDIFASDDSIRASLGFRGGPPTSLEVARRPAAPSPSESEHPPSNEVF